MNPTDAGSTTFVEVGPAPNREHAPTAVHYLNNEP
jgi:hypothetical protein